MHKHYISIKFNFPHIFSNDIVPIVMGARPEDYQKVAPPHSYIHVDDFDSPQQLAEYLHKLDQNDDLYNEYFLWKRAGTMIETHYWCRLCSLAHVAKQYPMWYGNLETWWRGPDICVEPRDKPWASWRNHTLHDQFPKSVKYGYDRDQ